jgi:hypothetical protein
VAQTFGSPSLGTRWTMAEGPCLLVTIVLSSVVRNVPHDKTARATKAGNPVTFERRTHATPARSGAHWEDGHAGLSMCGAHSPRKGEVSE